MNFKKTIQVCKITTTLKHKKTNYDPETGEPKNWNLFQKKLELDGGGEKKS
jgi:hypothetical protein